MGRDRAERTFGALSLLDPNSRSLLARDLPSLSTSADSIPLNIPLLQALRLGCVVNIVHTYGMEVTMCLGPSMLPTFNRSGDVVLLERVSVLTGDVARGDVVIARSPSNPRHTVCKRILGIGGDVIAVPNAGNFGGTTRVEVPLGHLWLQGDNAGNSTDSRDYGPVPYALLRGKVFVKVWPPSEAGWVKTEAWRHIPVR